jgi:acyl-CoA thioesterase YciA
MVFIDSRLSHDYNACKTTTPNPLNLSLIMSTSPLDDKDPVPEGELVSRIIAAPSDTNAHGDIHAGWLVGCMDSAGAFLAERFGNGRVTTVAMTSMVFLRPVPVGAAVSCYAQCTEIGRSSIRVTVEVWLETNRGYNEMAKVTEGEFVFVAIDDQGRTRAIKS